MFLHFQFLVGVGSRPQQATRGAHSEKKVRNPAPRSGHKGTAHLPKQCCPPTSAPAPPQEASVARSSHKSPIPSPSKINVGSSAFEPQCHCDCSTQKRGGMGKHLEVSSVLEVSLDFSMKDNSGNGLRNVGQQAKEM